MFRVTKPETIARLAAERTARVAQRSADLTARLLERYRTEPDRSYAEEMYGAMLRERGIDPAAASV